MKQLEVIVTSVEEARKAEAGGAHRLELVDHLELEGLTPSLELVQEVLDTVSIPVRVMLRDHPTFTIDTPEHFAHLDSFARKLSNLPVQGVVLGFLHKAAVDENTLNVLLSAATPKPATFHRAIEAVADVATAIETLKRFPQVDRVLTSGIADDPGQRRASLERLQQKAAPEITIIAGGGLTTEVLTFLTESPLLTEFHVGRAARNSAGQVCSRCVEKLRRLLEG